MNKKEVKKLITDPEAITDTTYSNNINNKLINKSILPNNTINTTDKIRQKNYELFNIVSETGDSIYSSSSSIEDLDGGGGQIFYSVNAIRDIVRQELVAAGIQVKSEE